MVCLRIKLTKSKLKETKILSILTIKQTLQVITVLSLHQGIRITPLDYRTILEWSIKSLLLRRKWIKEKVETTKTERLHKLKFMVSMKASLENMLIRHQKLPNK